MRRKLENRLEDKAPPKRKMSKWRTVPLIVFSVLLILMGIGLLSETDPTPTALTPARNLEGTWETPFPVTFYIRTDFTTGALEDVGRKDRGMTWTIAGTQYEDIVDVEVRFTVSNRVLPTGSGYTPDISPISLTGWINGTRLTLGTEDRAVGTFDFTGDIITGTWDDRWSMVYEQEVYTKANALRLTK